MRAALPIVRFTIAFAGGIIFQSIILTPPIPLFISAAVIMITAGLLLFRHALISEFRKFLLIYCAAFLMGALSLEVRHTGIRHHPVGKNIRALVQVRGTIEEVELMRQGCFRFVLSAERILFPDTVFSGRFPVICNVRVPVYQLDSLYSLITPGTLLKCEGFFSRGRERRNPGEFDYADYLAARGIFGQVTIQDAGKLRVTRKSDSFFAAGRHKARVAIAARADSVFSADASALFKGLVLGDRSEIDEEVRDAFINSGTAHVLAVSGLNVTYIMLIFLLLLGRLPLQARFAGAGVGILLFWILVGNSPPIARASLMGFLVIASVFLNRDINPLNTLFLAALIVLTFNPSDLFTASFQLSFAGVLSLIVLYRPLRELIESTRLPGLPKKILFLFAFTAAAQIGILPLTNYYFGKLSFTSFVSNLLIVPSVSAFMGAGILSLIISGILPALGQILANGSSALSWLIFLAVKLLGSHEFSYVPLNNFSFLFIGAYYAILALLAGTFPLFASVRNKTIALTLGVLSLSVIHIAAFRSAAPHGSLNILSIDVGQGDATLMILPDRTTILVDAGNAYGTFDNGKRVILPLLERLGIPHLNYAIISHLDSDHFKGIAGLLKSAKIKNLIKPPGESSPDSLLGTYARLHGAKVHIWKDSVWRLPDTRIYPLFNDAAFTDSTLRGNDKSICFIVQYGEIRILFTGDAQRNREERLMVSAPQVLYADILKTAHHGSKSGTTGEFLSLVRPRYALISAGRKNRYGHPHAETINRLNKIGAEVLRTDISGMIHLITDGRVVSRQTWE